jgi:uncharacterized protein with HEPN domain
MKTDKLYLIHIGECIDRILEYVTDGREAFMRETLIQDGVARNLQIMTESSQRISDALKAEHPEIDWRGMVGFRNVIVHDYLSIDLDTVWNVVERDLPALRRNVEAILEKLGD